jgi:glycosyltransferase involved in cell wall biosynthesis
LKLAYLSNSKIPSREANSIHVMKMCQAFAMLGHEVTLFAPAVHEGIEPDVSDPFAFYGVRQCFDLRKLSWRSIKGRGWIYAWEAARLAHRSAPDAAFGRCLHSCAVAARLGIPTVWDAHMLTFLHRRSERLLFRWMTAAAAFKGMTTNCDSLRRCILDEVPHLRNRITVAHNGADPLPEKLTPSDLSNEQGRLSVGYVGHLYPGKGLEIVREIAAKAPWADFHVVGGQEATVEDLRNDPTLPHNIRIHGFVPPAQAERLILAFDVVLAPYQHEVQIAGGGETATWMSPLKLFTYMSAGRAILCSDLPVLREIIEHGRNGLLVPPNDSAAWLRALHQLSSDPAERKRLGTAAHADFLARHTWEQRATRVLSCFTDLSAASARPRLTPDR